MWIHTIDLSGCAIRRDAVLRAMFAQLMRVQWRRRQTFELRSYIQPFFSSRYAIFIFSFLFAPLAFFVTAFFAAGTMFFPTVSREFLSSDYRFVRSAAPCISTTSFRLVVLRALSSALRLRFRDTVTINYRSAAVKVKRVLRTV